MCATALKGACVCVCARACVLVHIYCMYVHLKVMCVRTGECVCVSVCTHTTVQKFGITEKCPCFLKKIIFLFSPNSLKSIRNLV